MGDPVTGMVAGATINLAYLGWITAGGSMPGKLSVAGFWNSADNFSQSRSQTCHKFRNTVRPRRHINVEPADDHKRILGA